MASLTTGSIDADRVFYNHKARLECIEAAIHQLGRLRHEWGFSIDSLPVDINDARNALWKAYYAEQKRRPSLVPESSKDQVTDAWLKWQRAKDHVYFKPLMEPSEKEQRLREINELETAYLAAKESEAT